MATESYLLHCAWTFLEPLLCELCLAKDAALNAQVRRLCRTLSSSAGVPRDFLDRIPRARRELAHLERATTPRAKNLCLRKLTRLLASTAPMENNEEGRSERLFPFNFEAWSLRRTAAPENSVLFIKKHGSRSY